MKKTILLSALAAIVFVICTSSTLLPVTVIREDLSTLDETTYYLNPAYYNYLKKTSSTTTTINLQNFRNDRLVSDILATMKLDTLVNQLNREGYITIKLNVSSINSSGRDTTILYAFLVDRIKNPRAVTIPLNPSAHSASMVTTTTGYSKEYRFYESPARIKTLADSTTAYYKNKLLTDNRKQDTSYFKRNTGNNVDTFFKIIQGLKTYDTVRIR